MGYSIITPTYNSAKDISKNITKLVRKLNNLKVIFELIIVDDGSSDDTQKQITKFKKNKFIKVLVNKKNEGKSFSVIKGIKASKYKNIILIDSDLPYFSSFKTIISSLKKNNDLVLINRKLKKSKLILKHLSLYQIARYIIGELIARFNIKFLGIKIEGGDTQAVLKGFKKIANLEKKKFITRKIFFDLELVLIYTKKKLKILSLKTKYNIPKNSSIKLFNLKKNLQIIFELIKIYINYRKK